MGKLGLNSGYIGSDQRTTTNGVVGYDKFFLERKNGRFFPTLEFTGILDSYPGAAAAYSLRKLSSTYNGSAIRVRRSSDNTELDIGFTGVELNTSELLAFCGAGSGFVETWYDQSGNGYDATQLTAAYQPQVVSSGSVNFRNAKPALQFDGSNDAMVYQDNGALNAVRTGSFTYIGVVTNTRTSNLLWDAALHFGTNNTDGQGTLGMQFTGSEQIIAFHNSWLTPTNAASINISSILTDQLLIFQTRNGAGTGGGNNATVTNFINGLDTVDTQTWVSNSGSYMVIGSQFPTPTPSVNKWQGSIQELIVYPIDYVADRSNINETINNFYSIY